MPDNGLNPSQYEAVKRAYKPRCSACFDMDPTIFDWRAVPWATLYPDLDPHKIVAGADGNRPSCKVIQNAFQNVGLDLHTLHGPQYVSLYNQKEEGGSLLAQAVLDETNVIMVELFTTPDNPFSPWDIVSCKTHTSGNTSSEDSLCLIRQWVDNCEINHRDCSSQHTVELPTRVLDLGNSNKSIRLLETRGCSGRYICLSHCWGQKSTILSTTETYKSFQKNIPWEYLPLLFQNTIEICRMLKVQYLWIDKLCIIQHDLDDWAREGSRMAKTFENSFLTIAAAIAHNDKEPLYYRVEDFAVSGLNRHEGQTNDGLPYIINYRKPFRYHPTDAYNFRPGLGGYPLMKRAWVYQERLLASRMLYFGEEISWACKEATNCECSGSGHHERNNHNVIFEADDTTEKILSQWQNLVEEFTYLQLSFEQDRLPAFSGLAQRYQQHLNSEYLAGLWKVGLVTGLMWYAFPNYWGPLENAYSTNRPSKWLAPSWSWASVEGPILFSRVPDTERLTSLAKIISSECSVSSLDPMGAVANGWLVIKGSGWPTVLKHRENMEGDKTRHFTSRSIGISSISFHSNFTVDGRDANIDYDPIERGLMRPNSDLNVYCLCLATTPSTQLNFDRKNRNYFLSTVFRAKSILLHRVKGDTFERIGFLQSEFQDSGEQFQKSLRECTVTIV